MAQWLTRRQEELWAARATARRVVDSRQEPVMRSGLGEERKPPWGCLGREREAAVRAAVQAPGDDHIGSLRYIARKKT